MSLKKQSEVAKVILISTYMCSGWFLIQSIIWAGLICPVEILWIAVNKGNLSSIFLALSIWFTSSAVGGPLKKNLNR